MTLKTIDQRRSWFSFSEQTIDDEKLHTIFEAARLSPSSMNIQPWRYIYAYRKDSSFNLILETLAEGNKKWAKDAPVLILSIAQMEYYHNQNLFKNAYAWHDVGMANILLVTQAMELGIESHIMGGFDHKKVAQNFNLPKEYEPVTVIALGYKGDETKLPEEALKRQNSPRKRKDLNEIVFKGKLL